MPRPHDAEGAFEVHPLLTDAHLAAAFPLMRELRDRIHAETFVAEVRRQEPEGYRLFGGFADGHLVALAGVRAGHTLARGPHLFVDDLVTASDARGRGYGTAMIAWVRAYAVSLGVPRVYLDSRDTARSFYARCGFQFHTSIPCWIDAGPADPSSETR